MNFQVNYSRNELFENSVKLFNFVHAIILW